MFVYISVYNFCILDASQVIKINLREPERQKTEVQSRGGGWVRDKAFGKLGGWRGRGSDLHGGH